MKWHSLFKGPIVVILGVDNVSHTPFWMMPVCYSFAKNIPMKDVWYWSLRIPNKRSKRDVKYEMGAPFHQGEQKRDSFQALDFKRP